MMQTKWYKKFPKGCEMYFMFQDFWNLVQNYWRLEDSDEYWDSLIDSVNAFMNKYQNIYLARVLAIAFLDERDRQKGQ